MLLDSRHKSRPCSCTLSDSCVCSAMLLVPDTGHCSAMLLVHTRRQLRLLPTIRVVGLRLVKTLALQTYYSGSTVLHSTQLVPKQFTYIVANVMHHFFFPKHCATPGRATVLPSCSRTCPTKGSPNTAERRRPKRRRATVPPSRSRTRPTKNPPDAAKRGRLKRRPRTSPGSPRASSCHAPRKAPPGHPRR